MTIKMDEIREATWIVTAGFILCLAVVAMFAIQPDVAAARNSKTYAKFNKDGELLRPEGYRAWKYVGTPLTPNDMNDGKAPFPEFHSVYIDPKSWKVYENTGEFPDGTVLVKELISVGSKAASSGNGYFMGEFVGLEVSVKDSKRFTDEPNYWAYFRFTTPDHMYPYKKTSAMMATSSCNSCHAANAKQDMVFTQYYPVLRAMKKEAM